MLTRLLPAVLLSAALAATPADAAHDEIAAGIDSLMRRYHQLGQFNGSVLVAADNVPPILLSYGRANRDWNVANDVDTRFSVGSMTKSFTSTLIMQLISEGALSTDTRVSDILPDYRPDTGALLTVQHLLTHTDGLPNYTQSVDFWRSYENGVPYSSTEFLRRYCSGDLQFQPGSQYRYGNSGYSVLGAVIEELTGQDFDSVLRERILRPLAMHGTGSTAAPAVVKKRAIGYTIGVNGFRPADAVNKPLFAAGSMYSTVEDLRRFDRALDTDEILDATARNRMFGERGGAIPDTFAYGWNVGELELPEGRGAKPISFQQRRDQRV